MTASDIVSWVSNTLGLTSGTVVANPYGVLLARLPACVLRIQDGEHAGFTPKTITTREDVGEYNLGAGYDSVRSRVWPGDWYNVMPSLTGTHSEGSDITSENIYSRSGPRLLTPAHFRDFQAVRTAAGSTLEYPVVWTTWLNEKNELIFAVAPSEAVAADLVIRVELNISKSSPLEWDSAIVLEDHYEQLLRFMLAAEGASYAQGELLSKSDYAGAREYERLATKFLADTEREQARLVRTHNPTTNKSEVRKLGTPYFPPNQD